MKYHVRWLALVTIALGGCVQMPPKTDQPAVLDGSPESSAALELTLNKVFNRPVTLAPDAFTKDSSMSLEPVPARVDGVRIDGRETRAPEQFTLVRSEGECVLIRSGTGERFALRGARCTAR